MRHFSVCLPQYRSIPRIKPLAKTSVKIMTTQKKTLGIWGLGVGGKAALASINAQEYTITVHDTRTLSEAETALLAQYNATVITDLPTFLACNEYIIPSAGIDLRPFKEYQHKWLKELDLFGKAWHKPVVAITGTVGKTSITHLLHQLLTRLGLRVAVGGNIGVGMLSLLKEQESHDCALLEVSSFQLEGCTSFAPDLAIWTNFAPNHLDQHGTIEAYLMAKSTIYRHQQPSMQTLLGLSILEEFPNLPRPHAMHAFFAAQEPTAAQRLLLKKDDILFYPAHGSVVKEHQGIITPLIATAELPDCSYTINWVTLIAALHLMNFSLRHALAQGAPLTLPEHRLEKVATINGVTFYNDSKSTTPTSTKAALAQLGAQRIHLFLGGLSKGINRSTLIEELPTSVVAVYCFGKEAELLHQLCTTYQLQSNAFTTLEAAYTACTKAAQPGEVVLFSPSGSSFDLFKNYEERGTVFKQLVCANKAQ